MRENTKKHRVGMGLLLGSIALSIAGCGGGSSSPSTTAASTPTGIISITGVTTTPAWFGGYSFGAVGQYTKITGTANGQIDPNDPKNQVIADIALAPVNSKGMVEYSAPFYILTPTDPTKGNGNVLYEALNRGGKNAFGSNTWNQSLSAVANNPGTVATDATGGIPSTFPATTAATYPAFYFNKGYSVVWSAWDAEPVLNAVASNLMMATLPVAQNPDGSVITGPAYQYMVADNATTACIQTYYGPSPGSTATLTKRNHLTDTPIPLASTDWAWGGAGGSKVTVGGSTTDCTNPSNLNTNSISLTAGTFQQSWIYEITYTAQKPYVAAVGLAAMRDFVSFIKNAKADTLGTANPLYGYAKKVYGIAVSQPSRLFNDYVWLGFNQDTAGNKVFDALFNWIGGGDGLGMNYRFAYVGQTERNRQMHIAQTEGVFPFSYTTSTDPNSGVTDGRNVRCTASNTCPNIMNIFTGNEMWVKSGSALFTDLATGTKLVDPANVRNYFVSSAKHGTGSPPTSAPTTALHFDTTVDVNPLLRGLYVALENWTNSGTQPPASIVPSVAAGTLTVVPTNGPNTALGIGTVSTAALGWPNIPNTVGPTAGLVSVRNYWNYGPQFASKGILSIVPGATTGKFYQAYVPTVDANGNDRGGILLPEVVAPLGTNSGWGIRNANYGGAVGTATVNNDGNEGNGSFTPLAPTILAKITGDARPSLEELYGAGSAGKTAWLAKRNTAATTLGTQAFLLPNDVTNYNTSGLLTACVGEAVSGAACTGIGLDVTYYPQQYHYAY